MFKLKIQINNKDIYSVQLTNISQTIGKSYGQGVQLYKIFDEITGEQSLLQHKFEDGALNLGAKVINYLLAKERRAKN